ncbi:MAG: hypothetical protein ACMUIG_01805 [Thermoplasmatota archaeon]
MGYEGRAREISALIILALLVITPLSTGSGRTETVTISDCEISRETTSYHLTDRLGFREVPLPGGEGVGFETRTEFGSAWFHSGGIIYEIAEREREFIHLDFMGSNDVDPEGSDPLDTAITVISTEGSTEMRSFRSIIYRDLWDDIDLKYHRKNGSLKYDFIVRSGGDPRDIVIRVNGHREIRVKDESLSIETKSGFEIRDDGLKIYYSDDGTAIDGRMESRSGDMYGFYLDDVDPTREFVIDPFIFSSILGSADGGSPGVSYWPNYDTGSDMVLDGGDNIYIAGSTDSGGFPVVGGETFGISGSSNTDIFISKISANGSRILFSTIITGSEHEWANSLELDSQGRIWLMGVSNSADLPVTEDAMNVTDKGGGFILCLDPNGRELLYLSYIGQYGDLYCADSAIMTGDRLVLLGGSDVDLVGKSWGEREINPSDDTYNNTPEEINGTFMFIGIFDIVKREITRITFIGGDDDIYPGEVEIGPSGEICISGWTHCNDFPLHIEENRIGDKGATSTFLIRMDISLSSILSSIVIQTGSYGDKGDHVALEYDNSDNFFLGSTTESLSLDAENQEYFDPDPDRDEWNAEDNIFLLKIDPTGRELIGSLLYGGKQDEELGDIKICDSGGVYITGYSRSGYLFTTNGSVDQGAGYGVAILLVFDNDLSEMIYSGRFGGEGVDKGSDIELDSDGNVIIMGATESEQFFVTTNGFGIPPDSFYYETFIVKMDLEPFPEVEIPEIDDIVLTDDGLIVKWTVSPSYPEKEVCYDVYRANEYYLNEMIIRTESGADQYVDTNVAEGKTYIYKIRVIEDNVPSYFSQEMDIEVEHIPSVPINFRASLNDDGNIALTWEEPIVTYGFPITHYIIHRQDPDAYIGGWDRIAMLDGDVYTYVDEEATELGEYEYYIYASNINGVSGHSNTVSIEIKEEKEPDYSIIYWILGSIGVIILMIVLVLAVSFRIDVRQRRKRSVRDNYFIDEM